MPALVLPLAEDDYIIMMETLDCYMLVGTQLGRLFVLSNDNGKLQAVEFTRH